MAVVTQSGFKRGPHARRPRRRNAAGVDEGSPRGVQEAIHMVSVLILLFSASAVQAQHEVSGGSTRDVVGGSVTANVRSGRAPAKQPVNRPATPARRRSPSASKTRRMDADDYCEQGNKYLNAKQYPEAIEAYNNAVRLNPRFAEAYYGLGWINSEQGQYEVAIAALT